MKARPRLLLDTEALVRAFHTDGPARELLQRSMVRDCSLTTSTSILDELEDVLARPKFRISPSDRSVIRRVLLKAADDVVLLDEDEAGRYVRADPGDDHIVEAAIRTEADLLVSEDADLLELSQPPFSVANAGAACRMLREWDSGDTYLLSPEEVASERKMSPRATARSLEQREATVRFRELTSHLTFDDVSEGLAAADLEPLETAQLVRDLIRDCGGRLVFDARDGTKFDHLSGVRVDAPPLAPVALDLIWQTPDRAASEVIRWPLGPTMANLGLTDDSRCRSVLAGGLVLVLKPHGKEGPDLRYLALVDEPLAPVPDIHTEYRITVHEDDGGAMTVVAADPAGFSWFLVSWLAGGPSGLLSPGLGRTSLAFLFADQAARHFGLPVPPEEIVERRVGSALRRLIVRPDS